MTVDRYTRLVLTVIAVALGYLCVVLTPGPALQAQTQKPGVILPVEVTIIGWRVPKAQAVPVEVVGDVQVTGRVQAEQPPDRSDRVVLVGWEEGSTDAARGRRRALDPEQPGLPVRTTPQ